MSTTKPWKRDEPNSPCVDICVIHRDAKICIGCYRTGGEIAGWAAMDRYAQTALMETLPERAALLKKRRGGRRARQGS